METGLETPHRIPRSSSPAVNFRRSLGTITQAVRGGQHHANGALNPVRLEADNPSLVDFADVPFWYADEGTFVSLRAFYKVCPAAVADGFPPMLPEVPR